MVCHTIHILNHFKIYKFTGQSGSKHLPRSVWPELVYHGEGPEGRLLEIWPPGRRHDRIWPAVAAIQGLCFCLLWEQRWRQRGTNPWCDKEYQKDEHRSFTLDLLQLKSLQFFFFLRTCVLVWCQAKDRANGMELDGRRIRVDFSITKRPHTPTPGIYMGRPT